VNLCALDLSKAFDKVNHHALFNKLMKRIIYHPSYCVSLRIGFLAFFTINFGVRQGSILSPLLFCLYIDIVHRMSLSK